MITLNQFLETINYRITEGWEYQWHCFGPNAYCLDHNEGAGFETRYASTIIFDKLNQTVYSVEIHDYDNERSYRMINPEYVNAHRLECETHGTGDLAYDDVKYIDLETDGDFLQKLSAIIAGEPYDTRVEIELDIDDETLKRLMLMAHQQDITLNQIVEKILTEMTDRVKNGEKL